MSAQNDINFLRMAIQEAEKCEPSPTAFCVGCVLVVRWPNDDSEPFVLSTGYSRELPGNTHAEANALTKARSLSVEQISFLDTEKSKPDLNALLSRADVYTTLEPCSIRTSGLAPCADALIAANIKRCFIGVCEPDDFVKCEGVQRLTEAGIQVVWIPELEQECLRVARRGHSASQ